MSELVLNAAKHSFSEAIIVSIKTFGTETHISIQDHGKGFNPAQKSKTSLGIRNAEGRVAYLKGSLHIESSNGKGTIIQISVPQNKLL